MSTWGPWIDHNIEYVYLDDRADVVWYSWTHVTTGVTAQGSEAEFIAALNAEAASMGGAVSPPHPISDFSGGFGVPSRSFVTSGAGTTGYQFGAGFSADAARHAFLSRMPPLSYNPDVGATAIDQEFEAPTATYVGHAEIQFVAYRFFSANLQVTNYMRPAGWTDLTQSRTYDPAGANLWSFDAGTQDDTTGTPSGWIDVSSLTDANGNFAVKSASVVTGMGTDPWPNHASNRAAQVTWMGFKVRYTCRAPRVRYLYPDPPPPFPTYVESALNADLLTSDVWYERGAR
jgi:hypothetical protein